MRLLAFTNCPLDPALGSGKTVLRWSEGLRARGHEVTVVAPDAFTLARGLRRAKVWRQALGARLRGPGWLRRQRPDVVEFYGAEFGWLAQHLRRRRQRPLLVAHLNGLDALAHELVHPGQPDPSRHGPRWKALDALCFGSVDRVAAICRADAAYVAQRGWQPPENCAVVEPGLEPEFLEPGAAAPREHLVAFTGSWSARKDPETVARVMTALLREDGALRFAVLGAAPDAGAVRAAFPEAVRARVLVHGKLTNAAMAAELRRATVFLFPSLYEGYGMALAEAMACGCAAVATPTGLGAELRHGIEALICPSRDAAALGAAVRQLLRDEPLRQRLAQHGRARVCELTWRRQGAQLEALYLRWLGEPR